MSEESEKKVDQGASGEPAESPRSEPPAEKTGAAETSTPPSDAPPKGAAAPAKKDIAARVDALSEEDELDKVARLEEEKLAERRKGRTDLETAASKRLAKIGTKQVKRAVAARPVTPDDPVLARAKAAQKWIQKNPGTAAGVGGLVILALVGSVVFAFMKTKNAAGASQAFTAALADDRGRIGDPDKEDNDNGPHSPRPVFKTAEERRTAAMNAYEQVRSKYAGTGPATLARLAEGSLLLDKKDADGAAAAFQEVRDSALATADNEVRGRALEGLGFAYELKGVLKPEENAKMLDEAAKVYKDLENSVEVKGFKELAMYHQARVLLAKGDKDKAKELLVNLRDRIEKPGEGHPFPYLTEVVTDRLRQIDPALVPAKSPYGDMKLPEGMDPAMIQKLLGNKKGGAPH